MRWKVFLLLGSVLLSACQPNPNNYLDDDAPVLPSGVEGASDAMARTFETKLTKEGVRVISMGQRYMLSIPSVLLFAKDSPRFKPSAYDILNDAVCYLQQFRKISLHINAYGSCYQSEARTKELTLARSRQIGDYLWSQPVETRMMFTEGFGDDKPIVAVAKCSDGSANSRIEIIFTRALS